MFLSSPTGAGARRPRLRFAVLQLGLVLAVLLPATGFGGFAAWEAFEARQAGAEARLRESAHAASLALDREIDRHLGILRALAAAEALDGPAPDLVRFEAQTRRVTETFGTVAVLIDTATRRQVVNTSLPPGVPAGAAATVIGDQLLATGQHLVTDLVTGAVAGRPVIVVAVPVVRDGETRFLLSLRLEPEAFRRVLLALGLAPGVFASLTDSRGIVIARSDSFHEQRSGQPIAEENRRLLAEGISGTYRAAAFNGIEQVFGFQRLGLAPGWSVVVAQPAAVFNAPRQDAIWMLATGALLALVLGGLLATAIARSVVVPIRRLEAYARGLAGTGGLASPEISAAAIPPARVAELEALRDGFAAAEATLRGTEARLRSVLNTAIDGILVADERGILVFVNPAAARMFGYDAAGELIGQALSELMTDGDAAAHDAHLARHRTGAATRAIGVPGRPLIARRRNGEEFPVELSVGSFTDGEGHRFFTGVMRDASERAAAEARRNVLVGELNHRVKNTLATVLSIASQTLRERGQPPGSRERAFTGRLLALASAHDLLTDRAWEGTDLPSVIRAALAPWMGGRGQLALGSGLGAGRIVLSGPEGAVPLRPLQAQTFVLALHELATNAAKYGALSGEAGEVRVTWRGDGPGCPALLEWVEAGGPPLPDAVVTAGEPKNRGFGTRLLERSLTHDLGKEASVRLDFRREGLRAEIRFTAATLEAANNNTLEAAVREAALGAGD